MKLTYKIKHNLDLTTELALARKVAQFVIKNPDKLSTKYLKHFGLKSRIVDGILRKYGRNKRIKKIHSVPLIISGSKETPIKNGEIRIIPLKICLSIPDYIKKTGYIEIDKTYVYITYEVDAPKPYKIKKHIGVDLNVTGHCAVVAIKETGKVYKLGKKAYHIHKKYSRMRKRLQELGHYKLVKKIKHRESNIVRDLNHKISRKIANLAVAIKGGVQLEKLTGIRSSKVRSRTFRHALHSWSFFQLQKFIEYKTLLAGVPLAYVDPAYTSKACSRCGLIGDRNDKSFKCPSGHVEHADVNAAFNLALTSSSLVQLQAERDAGKRSIGTRQRATLKA